MDKEYRREPYLWDMDKRKNEYRVKTKYGHRAAMSKDLFRSVMPQPGIAAGRGAIEGCVEKRQTF